MKKQIIGIVAIIVIIGLVAIGFFGVGSSKYWPTPTQFGEWQDEIILYFADGTTESMKMIQEDIRPFTVYYGSKEITSAELKISAKATESGDSGYDGAELRTTGLGSIAYIKQGSNILQTVTGVTSNKVITIPMDATMFVCQIPVDLGYIIDKWVPEKYPTGVYTVEFVTKGVADYRGYPNPGNWESASLPPDRSISITVERTPTGSILVTLYSEVVT